MITNFLMWLLFGLAIGLVAWWIVKKRSNQPNPNATLLILSIIGALVGGALGKLLTASTDSSVSIVSLIIAGIGAVGLVYMYRNISPQS